MATDPFVSTDPNVQARLIAMGAKPASTNSAIQTAAVSKITPGVVVSGSQTGATPSGQGILSTPTVTQSYTNKNGVGQDANQFLAQQAERKASDAQLKYNQQTELDKATASGVTSIYKDGQWVQAPKDQAYLTDGKGGYNLVNASTGITGNDTLDARIKGIQETRAADEAYSPGTLSSGPARSDAATTAAGNAQLNATAHDQFAQLTQQFKDAQEREKAKTDLALQVQKAAQKEETATTTTAEFKLGQAGTDYAGDYLKKQQVSQQAQTSQLQAQFNDYIAQSDIALRNGNVALGKQLQAEAANSQKEALDLAKNNRDEAKAIDDMQKADVEKGGWIYSAAAAGIELSEKQLVLHDKVKGYQHGTSFLLQAAAQSLVQGDLGEAASKFAGALEKTDVGGSINLDGYDYIVSGKANGVIRSVTVDSATGENMATSYDPKTRATTSVPMGTFNSDWKIQKDDAGNLWRVDPKRKVQELFDTARPMTPGPSQKTNHAFLPEGTTPPPRPGGNPANAGQCGSYWGLGTQITDMPGDFDSYKGKLNYLSTKPPVDAANIQTGNTFLMGGYGETGHIGFVGDVIRNPQTGVVIGFMANESNMKPPNGQKVSYSRLVYLTDTHITGFYDIPTPGFPASGSDSQATSVASGFGMFGGKSVTEDKPLSFDELGKINATLPPEKQLAYGATSKDAAAKGAIPGVRITTPGTIDAKATAELASMNEPSKATWTNASEDDRNVARQLVNGDILLSEASSRAGAGSADSERIRLNKLALALDPTYSPTKNTQRNTFQTGWNDSNGRAYNTRVAGNTALSHLAELKNWTDRLKNSDFMRANSIKNALATETNDPAIAAAIQNFDYTAELVAHEIAAFYKGTASPTDSDVAEQRNKINNMKPNDILNSLINLQTNTMGAKIAEQGEEYKKVMGKHPDSSIIDSDSIVALKAAGVDTSRLENLIAKQTEVGSIFSMNGKTYKKIGDDNFEEVK